LSTIFEYNVEDMVRFGSAVELLMKCGI